MKRPVEPLTRFGGLPLVSWPELGRDEVVQVADPRMLAVRDAQWFVARLQVLTEVRDIFDRLRRDLGLPVPDRAGLTVVPA